MMDDTALSLSDLEAFDPYAPAGNGPERRFCCPLGDCALKTLAPSHRSLAVNTVTGTWTCHRCKRKGLLVEYRNRDARPPSRRERSVSAARRAFSLGDCHREQGVRPAGQTRGCERDWRRQLESVQALDGTPAETYLNRRGIPIEIARSAGARYSEDWYGRPAVVFPMRDHSSKLVAAHGRYIDGRGDPPSRTGGNAKLGVYATPGGWTAELLIITEAPIDALSLHACGLPAIALVGRAVREDWLPSACAFRRVLVATDADKEGDEVAVELARRLECCGAKIARLRPDGVKDWNELLTGVGLVVMRTQLREAIGLESKAASRTVHICEPAGRARVADMHVDADVQEMELRREADSEATDPLSVSIGGLADRIRRALSGKPLPIAIGPGVEIVDVGRYALSEANAVHSPCGLSVRAGRERLQRLGLGALLETKYTSTTALAWA